MPQMIAAGTTALMAVLALVIPALMNPPKDPSDWTRYRLEGAERATIAVLGWVCLLTVLLPEEPLILVPKREGHGTGATINVGHRAGRITVVVFLVVFVAGPLALVFAVS